MPVRLHSNATSRVLGESSARQKQSTTFVAHKVAWAPSRSADWRLAIGSLGENGKLERTAGASSF